jgi:hypothetical protein
LEDRLQGETKNRGKIWWTTGYYDSYRVEYKKTGGSGAYEWFKSNTEKGEIKIFDLEPDTEYEARVQAMKSGYYGQYSDIVKFRTLPERPAQCGENPDLPDQNNPGNPLTSIITGTVVNARGVDMTLLQVTPLEIPGWYKGIGQVTLDYFMGLSYGATFDRIYINENRDVVLGRIDVISESMAALVEEQIAANEAEAGTTTSSDPRWEDTDFHEEVFQYDIDITNVTVDAQGNVIIFDGSNNPIPNPEITAILVNMPQKAIIIEDKKGDQWVVQKDQNSGETTITKVSGGGLSAGESNLQEVVESSKVDPSYFITIPNDTTKYRHNNALTFGHI